MLALATEPNRCPLKALKLWIAERKKVAGPFEKDPPLFCHINGKLEMSPNMAMGAARLYTFFKQSCADAGLKEERRLSVHSTRSGFITQGAENGVQIQLLQQHARHVSIATTGRYIRQGELLLGDNCASALV